MAKHKLTLNLPDSVPNASQRVLEGFPEVVVGRDEGYVGELSEEQLQAAQDDPYIVVQDAEAAEASDEPQESELERLVKKNRKQLDKLAKKAGVEKPEELKDKQAVAEAIVAAEAAEAAAQEDSEDDDSEEETDEDPADDQNQNQ